MKSFWVYSALSLTIHLICLTGFGITLAECGTEISYQPVDISKVINGMAEKNGFLYTIGNGELNIYRIAPPPAPPQKTGTLTGLPSWSMRQICIHRNYAYITARHCGLWVVDVRNAENPKLVKVIPTEELATGIAVHGDALYVTMRIYGVEIFDISEPENPRHINIVRTREAQSAYCAGKWLAAGDWGSSSVMLFDLSDLAQPRMTSEISLDGFGDGVFIDGNFLYASTGHHARKDPRKTGFGNGHGMEIFDISNPQRPVRLGGVKFPTYYELGNDFWTLQVSGDTAFCADTSNGLFVVDVTDKTAPRITQHLRLPKSKRNPKYPEAITSLATGPGTVYFGGSESGLFQFRHSSAKSLKIMDEPRKFGTRPPIPEVPGLRRFDLGGPVRRLTVHHDTVFAALSQNGMCAFQIQPDGSPRILWNRPEHTVYDVAVAGDILAAAEDLYSIGIYQIEPGDSLREIGRYRGGSWLPIQFIRFFQNGKLLCAVGGTGRINFFDFSDPSRPRLKKHFSERRIFYSDALSDAATGNAIFANLCGAGIIRYNIFDDRIERTEKPPLQYHLEQLNGMGQLGDRQVIAYRKNQYLLIDPNCAEVKLDEMLCNADAPLSGIPQWDGKNKIAFSERRNGVVTLFDAQDPRKLKLLERFPILPAAPDRVAFLNGQMLIPGGNAGLYVTQPNNVKE